MAVRRLVILQHHLQILPHIRTSHLPGSDGFLAVVVPQLAVLHADLVLLLLGGLLAFS